MNKDKEKKRISNIDGADDEKTKLDKSYSSISSNVKYINHLSLVTQIGITIIANIATTLFIGVFLDRFFNTRFIFLIVFVFFGILSALLSVYKIVQKFF